MCRKSFYLLHIVVNLITLKRLYLSRMGTFQVKSSQAALYTWNTHLMLNRAPQDPLALAISIFEALISAEL